MKDQKQDVTEKLLKQQFENLSKQEQKLAPGFPSESKLKGTKSRHAPVHRLKPAYALPLAASIAAIALIVSLDGSFQQPAQNLEEDALATYMQIMDSNLITTDEFLLSSDTLMPAMTEFPRFQPIQPSPVFDI